MTKNEKHVKPRALQKEEIENPHFSPVFCGYLLNNWCGISLLWTSFHLSDQSKHGCTKPYKDWRTLNIERSCVKSPPETQGILELHDKSTKHMVLSSNKEKIDNLVMELVEWKEAKWKAYTVQTSRSDLQNVTKKNMVKLPKLVKETWLPKKRKSGKGPGFYQFDKSKKRRGIAANNAEENSAQNINLENETKEERETLSSAHQSSAYLKDINLKYYDIEPESETIANLEKTVQQCFLEIDGRKQIARRKSQI